METVKNSTLWSHNVAVGDSRGLIRNCYLQLTAARLVPVSTQDVVARASSSISRGNVSCSPSLTNEYCFTLWGGSDVLVGPSPRFMQRDGKYESIDFLLLARLATSCSADWSRKQEAVEEVITFFRLRATFLVLINVKHGSVQTFPLVAQIWSYFFLGGGQCSITIFADA